MGILQSIKIRPNSSNTKPSFLNFGRLSLRFVLSIPSNSRGSAKVSFGTHWYLLQGCPLIVQSGSAHKLLGHARQPLPEESRNSKIPMGPIQKLPFCTGFLTTSHQLTVDDSLRAESSFGLDSTHDREVLIIPDLVLRIGSA